MSEFIKTERGRVAISEIVAIERNSEGKAILDLKDESSKVSADDYVNVVEDLGVVIPNTTGCVGLTIELADPSEPEVDGQRQVYVYQISIVAWRVNGQRAMPITYTGDHVKYILNPNGSVEQLDMATYNNLSDAINSVRTAAT